MCDSLSNNLKAIGPYDPATADGKAANSGYAAAKATADGSIFGKNVRYAYLDKNGMWNPSSSLAFSNEELKTMDANVDATTGKVTSDGKVTADDSYWGTIANQFNKMSPETRQKLCNPALLNSSGEFDKQAYFNQFDLNNSGDLDAAERTAYQVYMDTPNDITKNDPTSMSLDGKTSQTERDAGFVRSITDPNMKNDMTQIYQGLGLDQAQENYEMPNKLPYDMSTPEGMGANSGYLTAQAAQDGTLCGKDIKYGLYNEDGAWVRNSSLAFSTEALKAMDGSTGDDGNVSKDGQIKADDDYWKNMATNLNKMPDELKQKLDSSLFDDSRQITAQNLFNRFDINGNGVYDAADDTAVNCYEDRVSNAFDGTDLRGTANDGILSQDERDIGKSKIIMDPNASTDLKTIYDHYQLDDAYSKFKMPDKITSEE